MSVFLAATLAAAACASGGSAGGAGAANHGAPEPGGTLRVVRFESFDGWNLDSAAAYASYQTDQAVIEPLVRFSPDGKTLEPGLAESWKYNPDGPSWTFELRDGLTFSDGTPLTSADVAFSAKEWKAGHNFGVLYSGIKKVRTPDERTVVIDLYAPDTTLPVVLSWSSSGVMPKDFGGKTKDQYFASPIGAGAFVVEDWSPGGQIVLARNPHFYDPARPYADKVVIDVVADNNERATMFQAGQADVAEYVSPIDASKYGDSLVALPASQVEHLSMNTTKAPFDDIGVRRAVAQAIDYRSIYEGVLKGYADAPNGILPPNLAHSTPPTKPGFTTDIEAAKQELAASSYPNPDTVELIYDSGNAVDGLVAQIVQADLAKAGIKVEVSGLETGAFVDRAFGLDSELVLWSYGAISPDAIDPVGWVLGTSWLFTGFQTDDLGKEWGEYTSTQSDDKKKAIIAAIQDQNLEDVQAISLAEAQVLHGVSSKVGGLKSAPWGTYYYDTVWLES